jgi:hypothetical protein
MALVKAVQADALKISERAVPILKEHASSQEQSELHLLLHEKDITQSGFSDAGDATLETMSFKVISVDQAIRLKIFFDVSPSSGFQGARQYSFSYLYDEGNTDTCWRGYARISVCMFQKTAKVFMNSTTTRERVGQGYDPKVVRAILNVVKNELGIDDVSLYADSF